MLRRVVRFKRTSSSLSSCLVSWFPLLLNCLRRASVVKEKNQLVVIKMIIGATGHNRQGNNTVCLRLNSFPLFHVPFSVLDYFGSILLWSPTQCFVCLLKAFVSAKIRLTHSRIKRNRNHWRWNKLKQKINSAYPVGILFVKSCSEPKQQEDGRTSWIMAGSEQALEIFVLFPSLCQGSIHVPLCST